MRIAYIVNTYPRPSHSFIRREVLALERQGIDVHRFAMRSERASLVDPADLAEDDRTEHVLKAGLATLAVALLRALVRAPLRMLAALRLALACGGRVPGGARLLHLVYLAEAAHVAARCRVLGIGHLHAHFGTNSTTVAMLAHLLGGPRYSFTVHGPEEFDAPEALSLGAKIQHAAFCVAISSFGRSQLMRWADPADWNRIKVVHCGIEPKRFAKTAPLPPGSGRMVAIGRLAEQKGQLLLIEALARARETEPALHLTLVGDGPLRGKIEAAVQKAGLQDQVTLTGWLDEAGVRAELAAAHALVLPSFAEGLPMVVMEAMAAGRPVLATWVAGVPELVRDGENGWLIAPGDIGALCDAMHRLARTPEDRLAVMGQAARIRVLERHGIDDSATRLAGHFARAIAGD